MKTQWFAKDIVYNLAEHDTGFLWYEVLSKNKIGFDNDDSGKGFGPYLELTCYKEFARFTYGTDLTKKEQKLKFYYNDYETIEEFCQDISKFTSEFTESFETIVRRKTSF